MGRMKDKLKEIMTLLKSLQTDYATEINVFLGLLNKAESGKALDIREKELINVALAVPLSVNGASLSMSNMAGESGMNRHEIVEVDIMAVVMHGGPAYMCMMPLLNALDKFQAA